MDDDNAIPAEQDQPRLPVHPSAAEVCRWRMALAILLRVIGVFCGALALWPLGSWLAEGLQDGDLGELGYYAGRIIVALILIAVGLAFSVRPGWIAKHLVPMPRGARCPGCGFDLRGLRGRVCTECGLDVTAACPELSGGQPSYGRWHAAAVLSLRVLALFLLSIGVLSGINSIILIVYYSSDMLASSGPGALPAVGMALVQLLPGVVIWIFAPRLARLALRGAAPWAGSGPDAG